MLPNLVGCPCFPLVQRGSRAAKVAQRAGLKAEPAETPVKGVKNGPGFEVVPSPASGPTPPAHFVKCGDQEQNAEPFKEATPEECEEAASKECEKEVAPDASPDNWRGVALLSLAWACSFATLTAAVAVMSLAGKPFSPSAGADTVPLACVFYFSGLANAAIPYEINRLGRRGAYLLGAAVGVVGSIVCALAVLWKSFILLCLGGSLLGMSIAHAQNYRFAAILLAHSNPPKAVSWVTAGGVLGAALGPGVLARARYLFPAQFTGVYVLSMVMFVIALVLLYGVNFPDPAAAAAGKPIAASAVSESRNLASIFSQPRCWAATVAQLSAYVGMMIIMAPTPLVMRTSFGHSYDEATFVMLLHMVLMFAPSPGTGKFIAFFGPAPVMLAGCACICLAATVVWMGTSLLCFFVGLGFLGIGWNFLFLSGTTQLASTYKPSEGPKVQALSDGLVLMSSGTASLVSAPIVESLGWELTQVVVMVFMAVTAAAVSVPPALENFRGRT